MAIMAVPTNNTNGAAQDLMQAVTKVVVANHYGQPLP